MTCIRRIGASTTFRTKEKDAIHLCSVDISSYKPDKSAETPHSITTMSAQPPSKTAPSMMGSALAALIMGWSAPTILLALPIVYLNPGRLDAVGDLLLFSFCIAFPCWFFVVVPLAISLRPDLSFWRYHVSIPFGAVVCGLICLSVFMLIIGDLIPWRASILPALSGAVSGGTLFGLLSWRNQKSQARNA